MNMVVDTANTPQFVYRLRDDDLAEMDTATIPPSVSHDFKTRHGANRAAMFRRIKLEEVTEQKATSTVDVAGVGDSKPWFTRCIDLLRMMSDLGDDWHASGVAPPNATARAKAAKVLSSLSDASVEPSRIAPSSDEAVCIAFKKGKRYADIECYNSGDIIAIVSDGEEFSEIWQVSDSAVTSAIDKISEFMAG